MPDRCRCWCSARRSARRPPPCGRQCGPCLDDALPRRRLGPARPRPQHRASRPSVHDGRAGRRRAGARRRRAHRRGEPGGRFAYAGDSVGGAVGLQLLLDAPDRVAAAVLLCTGAKIGDADELAGAGRRRSAPRAPPSWSIGPPSAGSRPASSTASPRSALGLLHALRDADDEGYAGSCEALADFDVRDRLGEIAVPVLAVAGAEDVGAPRRACSRDRRRRAATAARRPRRRRAPGAGRGARGRGPADRQHVLGRRRRTGRAAATGRRAAYDAGMAVRREVLGDAHVDRATAAATDLTRDFQELITEYAWGSIWTRPGLDRRSRSLITLTALVARGHHEELAMHVRAARTNGLTRRRDQGAPAADRDLLRRPRRQHRLPDRPARAGRRGDDTRGEVDDRGSSMTEDDR